MSGTSVPARHLPREWLPYLGYCIPLATAFEHGDASRVTLVVVQFCSSQGPYPVSHDVPICGRIIRSPSTRDDYPASSSARSSARPKNALSSSRDGSKSPPGRHSGRRGRDDRTRAMTEQKEEPKKNVAVDLECDDEFEEFGNEGAWRPPASQISPSIPPSPRRINPKRALTHTRPAFRPRRVGSRGGGRRGRQPVGGGLGRHRDQRRLHQAAPRRARALRPVMRTRSGGTGRRVPRGPDRREALHRPFETRGM